VVRPLLILFYKNIGAFLGLNSKVLVDFLHYSTQINGITGAIISETYIRHILRIHIFNDYIQDPPQSLISYVFTIWHKFRPLGVGESVTYSRRSSPEAKFCRCVKREKLIPGIEKVQSMESTMVGVKEMKQSNYF
jgi:hypothetical protein